jgi:hypothetical protein
VPLDRQPAGHARQTEHRQSGEQHPLLASAVYDAASAAFFHGFHAANYLAAGVAGAGAVMALWLLPAHPLVSDREPGEVAALGSPLDPRVDPAHLPRRGPGYPSRDGKQPASTPRRARRRV